MTDALSRIRSGVARDGVPSQIRRLRRGVAGAFLAVAIASGATGCHGLMDVSDPTLIQDKDIATASGANARRLYSVVQLSTYVGTTARDVALFTDEASLELRALPTNPPWARLDLDLDRRDENGLELLAARGSADAHLGTLSQVFIPTSLGIYAMRSYGADSVKHEYLAQLFSIRAYAVLQMAEDICSGFPINDMSTSGQAILSRPYPTDSAIAYAITQADSAIANGHDSTQFLDFARVVKGRALLDLGRYADAAAVVASVTTDFAYTTDPSTLGNQFYTSGTFSFAMEDREGGNGEPFVSAQDLRVPSSFKQVRFLNHADSLYMQEKYTSQETPIVLASGVEARLIEAEAALHASDPEQMTDILNGLRATAGLADLVVPATADAQVDMLYHERAFWLYLTGRRLGDLRRLMRNYGRTAASVYPTGTYPMGGSYGTATSIPFTVAAQGLYNPNITTGCAAQ